jgi:sterol desaturase/sphingolipid hydroxylase (fatty acid hydroxylase superfamily)
VAEGSLANEGTIRLTAFLGVFVLMAIWEVIAARRELSVAKGPRWFANLGLVVVDTVVVRLLFPAAAIGMAIAVAKIDFGLFHWLTLPYWLTVVLSILMLDFAIYVQHVIFHAIPTLWRLHMVHHADVDVDVTTGLRFHPAEIIVSMVIKLAVVAVLGPPLLAVLVFEVLLNALAMFNHANVRMPARFERILRWLIVTPDMHRIHHSIDRAEHDTNYGFNLSCWDRLMGTYLARPAKGQTGMTLGLPYFRDARWRTLPRILIMPLNRQTIRSSTSTSKQPEPPNLIKPAD